MKPPATTPPAALALAPQVLAAQRWVLDVEASQSFADLPAVGYEQRQRAIAAQVQAKEADQDASVLDVLGPAAADFLTGPDRDTPGVFFVLGEGSVPTYQSDGYKQFIKGYGGDEWSHHPTVSVWQDVQAADILGDEAGSALGSLVAQLATFPSWVTAGGADAAPETASHAEIAELIGRMAEAERLRASSFRREAATADARADAVEWRRLNPGSVSLPPESVSVVARNRVRQMAMALLEAAESETLPAFHQQTNESFKAWCAGQIGVSKSTAWEAMKATGVAAPGAQGKTGHALGDRVMALLDELRQESPELRKRVENVENRVLGRYGADSYSGAATEDDG